MNRMTFIKLTLAKSVESFQIPEEFIFKLINDFKIKQKSSDISIFASKVRKIGNFLEKNYQHQCCADRRNIVFPPEFDH